MITVAELTKAYGETTVVDSVSFTLPGKGVTSIIGANGAGKSTLLSLISRVVNRDAGAVEIDGLDVFNAPGNEIARRLSILRQEPHTAARITVRELVEFGRYPHSKGRLTAECARVVDESMAFCDLFALKDRPIDQLSGGQRQRAYIAMVLAQDTPFVMLDEPLNNLDLVHATSTMHLLRRLANERGKSIVLVLHDINYASVHSDRIIAMRDGAILHDGPPSQIITQEVLGDIYGTSFTVHEVGGVRFAAYFQ